MSHIRSEIALTSVVLPVLPTLDCTPRDSNVASGCYMDELAYSLIPLKVDGKSTDVDSEETTLSV